MRQKCVNNARNTFGGEHPLDDTENRRFEAICANRSHVMKIVIFCESIRVANRFGESPRFALQIAGPSKLLLSKTPTLLRSIFHPCTKASVRAIACLVCHSCHSPPGPGFSSRSAEWLPRYALQLSGIPSVPECTAVAAIQLRMRMRIRTRLENSLANFWEAAN